MAAYKNALITGGTSGIGYEIAGLMAADGWRLAITGRNASRLAERADTLEKQWKLPVKIVAKDLAKPEGPTEIFDELERANFPVHALVNNAGFGVFGQFCKTSLADELQMMETNMAAPVQLTKLFLKPMLQRGEGRILQVASTAAFQPVPWLSVYSASKAFLLSFSCALAAELRGTGVTVTTLCPGGTRTEFQERAGMSHTSGLFGPMSALKVAKIGYRAMLRGRPLVVAGWQNKLMIAFSRQSPIMWTARAAALVNRSR